MKQINLVIQNKTGLHARPAKVLVNLAKQFKADIRIQHGPKKANAKSMVSILTLGAGKGSSITLEVDGEDEDLALDEIANAIRAGLGDTDGHPEPNGQPSAPPPSAPTVLPSQAPGILQGVSAAPGIAVGPLFHFQQTEPDLLTTEIQTDLATALSQARAQLTHLSQQMKEKKLGAEAAIFEAHIELLEDPELNEAVQTRIANGENPAIAWQAAIDERAATLASLKDEILSARAADLRDVGRRVLRIMLGAPETGPHLPSTPVIIIARDLSPSDTAAFDSDRVLGFCIVEGGPTSHIAILARALGLPAIVGAPETILSLPEKTPVILNGNDGTLTPNPAPDVLERAAQVQHRWLEYRRFAQEQSALPATTLDGHHIDITANAKSIADAAEALKMGADGIGLLRTEFLFLDRTTAPTEDEQYEVYRAIAQTMHTRQGNRPVIIRTLDIGGDKPLPYIQQKPEMNPFLGERGIRLCLNRPELFREQLRAILRATPFGDLRIMFPMVSDLDELHQARALMDELANELGTRPAQIGIMIEVPSAALLADKFAPEIDFFSIGTNDLTQYTLAMDRTNPALGKKQDGLHPAVLRLIAMTANAAHQHGKRVDVCGELGSDVTAIPILLGLGIHELSVSIPAIPTVKALVRTLKLADIQPLAQQALACSTAEEVRALVKKQIKSGD
ncbi:MAG: phosphoenolpyruvate--protein phosphotransferase [Anaerolineales bacterium]